MRLIPLLTLLALIACNPQPQPQSAPVSLLGVDVLGQHVRIAIGPGLELANAQLRLKTRYPTRLTRNPDGSYPFTSVGGLVFRNGVLQIETVDFLTANGLLIPIPKPAPWLATDNVTYF